jgi:drug/metabolite transporter (DMT)-like permease
MEKVKKRRIIAKIALVITTMIWGSSFVVMKDSVQNFPVNYLLAIRFSMATIVIALIFIKHFKKFDKGHLIGGILMGIALFLAYEAQTFGIVYTTPAKNAFLTVTYCVIVPFLYVIFFRKRLSIFNFIAAFICIIGIGFISLDKGLSIELGDSLSILCGFLFAIHILVIEKVSKKRDAAILTVIQFATVSVLSFIVALFTEKPPQNVTIGTLAPLIYLAVFATGFCFFCQTYGQKYTPPTTASILLSLESVFGVLVSIIFGYDKFSTRLFIGFALVFIAIIISETDFKELGKKTKSKKEMKKMEATNE